MKDGDVVSDFQNVGSLLLDRCPHCGRSYPSLLKKHQLTTEDHSSNYHRYWGIFVCTTCGGPVIAGTIATKPSGRAIGLLSVFPRQEDLPDDIPETPRRYLDQAINAIHAPDAAVMVAASSVDAMLKEKGLTRGSLYERIDKAVTDHLLTEDMGRWAHQVRLDANEPRHADAQSPHHTVESAKQAIQFAQSLAEILFVLPARVTKGIRKTEELLRKP
jgi:hypothetical protein